MGYSVNKMKVRAEELSEGYQEARDDAFNDEFVDFITGTPTDVKLTEDDVQGFLDSFDFEDEDEWAFNEVQSELDDIGDALHEQRRDERMGL